MRLFMRGKVKIESVDGNVFCVLCKIKTLEIIKTLLIYIPHDFIIPIKTFLAFQLRSHLFAVMLTVND